MYLYILTFSTVILISQLTDKVTGLEKIHDSTVTINR